MEVSKKDWESKLDNLHTRVKGISSEYQINYKELLSNVNIGKNVLDIGCGTCWLKKYIPKDSIYTGMDAYLEGEDITTIAIEDLKILPNTLRVFDTIFIFAAIDGMRDLKKAFDNIIALDAENVVILTGINIEPDLYHTHLITEQMIEDLMSPYIKSIRKQVHEKIIFLEFVKP